MSNSRVSVSKEGTKVAQMEAHHQPRILSAPRSLESNETNRHENGSCRVVAVLCHRASCQGRRGQGQAASVAPTGEWRGLTRQYEQCNHRQAYSGCRAAEPGPRGRVPPPGREGLPVLLPQPLSRWVSNLDFHRFHHSHTTLFMSRSLSGSVGVTCLPPVRVGCPGSCSRPLPGPDGHVGRGAYLLQRGDGQTGGQDHRCPSEVRPPTAVRPGACSSEGRTPRFVPRVSDSNSSGHCGARKFHEVSARLPNSFC